MVQATPTIQDWMTQEWDLELAPVYILTFTKIIHLLPHNVLPPEVPGHGLVSRM